MSPSLFTALFLVWFVGVLTNNLLGGLLHLVLAAISSAMLARIVQAEPPFAGGA